MVQDTELELVDPSRKGWFKILVVEVTDVLAAMMRPGRQIQFVMLPFLYGRLDEVTAEDFPFPSSIPFLKVISPTFALADRETQSEAKPLSLISLRELAPDHKGEMYIPVSLISGIIPIEPKSPVVDILMTLRSGVQMPSQSEILKILDSKEHN